LRRPPRGRRSQQAPELSGPRVNHGISSPRVLVIDGEGNKLGEFMTEDAINLARERSQDLIEVAPNARPPVCRLGDYGKMKYEKKKRDAEARKKQTIVSVKEVKLRPKTDIHDYQVKLKATRKFLEKGDKVKVTVRFRGREMAHREIGEQRCLAIAEEVVDIATIEHRPSMEGRQMFCILAPIGKK
jgi:translation initiation factor IF-3